MPLFKKKEHDLYCVIGFHERKMVFETCDEEKKKAEKMFEKKGIKMMRKKTIPTDDAEVLLIGRKFDAPIGEHELFEKKGAMEIYMDK